MSRPPGRPRLDNPRDHGIETRLTADERNDIDAAAAEAGLKPAVWLRHRAVAAAKRELRAAAKRAR